MVRDTHIVYMRKLVAIVVLIAILVVLFSSPLIVAATAEQPEPDSCCTVHVEPEEPSCCAHSEASGCCFTLYLPPATESALLWTETSDAVSVEPFYFRESCNSIFEPPKV